MATLLRFDTGGGGGKTTAAAQATTAKGRVPADDTADVRDILGALVGKGVTNLSDDTSRAHYSRLINLLGAQKANKLMTQVFSHNTRSGNVPMEKRIQSFYDIGSNDPEVSDVIKNVKSFGYGVLPGFRESGLQTNQELTGRVPMTTSATDNSDLQKQIMLRLQK